MYYKWRPNPYKYRPKSCDRCRRPLLEGCIWPDLGVPLVFCEDCAEDIEESVRSYGEDQRAAQIRLRDRLRSIGA